MKGANVRRLLGLIGSLLLLAAFAQAQTDTPTPTETNTPTPTFTPSNTPTPIPVVASSDPLAVTTIGIPNGADASASIKLSTKASYQITILSPATLDGTLKLEVSEAESGGTWRTYQVAAADVAGPLATKAATFAVCCVGQLRIKQSTNAIAVRLFQVTVVKIAP